MPKYKAKPIGAMAWLFLAIVGAGLVYAAVSYPTVAAIVLLLLCIAFAFARMEVKRDEDALRKLADARIGESICEFAREFDARAIDTWVIRAVYEQVQAQLTHVHPAFPIRASDRLKEDLRLDDDTLDMDFAVEVEQRTGRSLDDVKNNPHFGYVKTVVDLVLLFQAQSKRSAA